jgi:hypothetical protein
MDIVIDDEDELPLFCSYGDFCRLVEQRGKEGKKN